MREIKFRGREIESKWQIAGFNMFGFSNFAGGDHQLQRFGTKWNEGEFILEQYTGLKDMNDIEIYEGDIVRLTGTGEDPMIIVSGITFGSLGACYKHDDRRMRLDMFCGEFKDSRILTTVEIIGDIHNNTELLNGK